jgi:putative membrane protein
MEYMIQAGFLGTRAPFFMDSVVIIVALLPFLIALGIWFARLKYHKLHYFFQTILFIVTVVVLIYFEYGIKLGGGFYEYMKESSIDLSFALSFLIFHIIIATITMIMWGRTIKIAFEDRKRRALPGLYSKFHRKSGRLVAFFIFLTSITGVGVYIILFIE